MVRDARLRRAPHRVGGSGRTRQIPHRHSGAQRSCEPGIHTLRPGLWIPDSLAPLGFRNDHGASSSSLPGRATDPGLSVPTRIACAIERVAGGNTARVTVGTLRFAHPTRCARLLNEPVRPFLHRVAAITSDQPTDGTSAHEPLLPRGGERPASVPTYSPWTEGTSILPSCGTGSDRSSNTRPHGRRSIMFRLSFSCIIRASFPKSG
jgi:hypothetical protein